MIAFITFSAASNIIYFYQLKKCDEWKLFFRSLCFKFCFNHLKLMMILRQFGLMLCTVTFVAIYSHQRFPTIAMAFSSGQKDLSRISYISSQVYRLPFPYQCSHGVYTFNVSAEVYHCPWLNCVIMSAKRSIVIFLFIGMRTT